MRQRIHFCTANDSVRLAYAVSGSGPPLVKAAHYLTHVEHDWDSPVWRHWLQGLSANHTLVRYDERGCGLSDRDVDRFDMDAWVDDLQTVVDAAGLDTFDLLGVSQGGAVAIAYIRRHPERVRRLVLYGAYARGRLARARDDAAIHEASMFLELMRHGWGRNTPAFRQVFTTLFMPRGTKEQIDWFNDLQRWTASAENAARFEEAFYQIDVQELARGLPTPTLILHARNDAMIPFSEGRELAALIPSSTFVPLDSENHILLDEPAFRTFLAELEAFLGSEVLPAPFDELTPREREVLELIARGHSNDEIAGRLSVSPHTVRNHINRVFAKLGVRDRAQAIVAAHRAGIGTDP